VRATEDTNERAFVGWGVRPASATREGGVLPLVLGYGVRPAVEAVAVVVTGGDTLEALGWGVLPACNVVGWVGGEMPAFGWGVCPACSLRGALPGVVAGSGGDLCASGDDSAKSRRLRGDTGFVGGATDARLEAVDCNKRSEGRVDDPCFNCANCALRRATASLTLEGWARVVAGGRVCPEGDAVGFILYEGGSMHHRRCARWMPDQDGAVINGKSWSSRAASIWGISFLRSDHTTEQRR